MSQTIAAPAGLRERIAFAAPCYLPERNPHFRGRKQDLSRLRESLNKSRTIGITQQVALCASGGVGKSSVALEFAWDCFAADPPIYAGGVFWCDCRSRDISSLADGLASFASTLGLNAADGNDPMPTARLVRDRLTNGPQCLLILDNVIDSEQWKDKEWNALLPGGNCSRLLTTRSETVGDQRVPMLSLATLTEEDARELLHSYRQDVPLHIKGDTVSNVIDWFGGLAVGLTVVGIYLGIHAKVTWDEYWRSLRDKKLDTVRETEDLVSPADYTDRVDAVIDDIFRSLSPSERRALFYVSLLPGEDVSDRWLRELLEDDLNTRRISGNVPPGYPSLPQAIITRLMQRGILLRSIETPTRKTVSVHQVVRERIRELLKSERGLSHELSAHVRQLATRVYHRSRQWTRAISECTDMSEAQRLLDSMLSAECDPDVYTFTALLSKAGTMGEAKAIFAQLRASGNEPTLFTFNTLLTRAETYDDAKNVIAQMEAAGEKPDEFSLNTLLWKADDFTEAKGVIEQIKGAHFEPNAKAFNRLLALAPTFDESTAIMEQMRKKGYKPHSFFFRKLMWLAKSFDQAMAVATQAEADGAKLGEEQFRAWLSKTSTEEQINFVVARGEAAGFQLKQRALNRKLKNAATFNAAMDIFLQILKTGQKPIWITFQSLLAHAKSDEEVLWIAEQMRAAGVQPKEENLIKMLLKTKTEQEARTIVAKLEASGVRIFGSNLKSALPGAANYPEAKGMITEMLAKNKKPSVVQFTSLFSQQDGLPHVEEVLSWYYGLPNHPSDPLNALVTTLRMLNRVGEAMTVVLKHSHLPAGQCLMREFPDRALAFFESAKACDCCHPTADQALGILAIETNRPSDAKVHLTEALKRANHPKKIASIQSALNSLG